MESPIDTTKELILSGTTPIVPAGLWPDYLLNSVNEWQLKAGTTAFILEDPSFK